MLFSLSFFLARTLQAQGMSPILIFQPHFSLFLPQGFLLHCLLQHSVPFISITQSEVSITIPIRIQWNTDMNFLMKEAIFQWI